MHAYLQAAGAPAAIAAVAAVAEAAAVASIPLLAILNACWFHGHFVVCGLEAAQGNVRSVFEQIK